MDDRDRWCQFYASIVRAKLSDWTLSGAVGENSTFSGNCAKLADLMLEEYHKRFVKDTVSSPYRKS